MKEIKGRWTYIIRCVECKHELSGTDYYDRGGVCPYCGHAVKGTLCDAVKSIVRPVYELGWFLGVIPYFKFIKYETR